MSSSSSSLGSNFMQRSLSSPALHLLTAQLHSPTTSSSSTQNSSTSQPSSSSLSAASPPPSAPSSSSSSSSSSLTRSRSSRRRQSLAAGHHLSDVQEGAPSPRKKSPLSLVDQRFAPYDRSQPQGQDQPSFSSFSSVGASPGADSFSSKGGTSDRRFRSVGLVGTGGSTSGGSVDEFGVHSYDQTPPLSLTGSSSQRSTSSLGEMEYQSEGAYRHGLGVSGFEMGSGGRSSESEGTECGRSSDRLQLEDVLEGDVYESPGREQSVEGQGSGREVSYGQTYHQPGLMSPFLPSAPATPTNVASRNSTYLDHSYPPQPPPLPLLGSPYTNSHYSQPSHQQHPQGFHPDLGRRSLPSPSQHSPSYLPHIRTSLPYPTNPSSHNSPSYQSPPLTSPYSTGSYSHPSHHNPNVVASPAYPLPSPRHLLSSSSSTTSYPPAVGPPPGYARVELDLTTIPTSLVLPPPKQVAEEKPAPVVATRSTLKSSASNSTLHAPKLSSRPSTASSIRPEGPERGVPAPVVLPSEVAQAKAEAVQAARAQKGVRIKQKLTNEDKLEIILSHDNDPTLTQQESATKYGVDRSTISKITNNRERWLNPQISPIVVKDPTKTDFRPLGGRFVRAETQTNEWLDAQFLAGVSVEDMQIRDQAVIFHNTDRGFHEKEFRGSTKWLHSFKERRRLAKTWLAAPVPPGTSPSVASTLKAKAAVPSPRPKKQPSIAIAIASPTPKRPTVLVINRKRLSYSQEAPPMTATSSTSSFGGASSSSSSSSIFSPHQLQSSFSSRGSSPSVATTSLPLTKSESEEQPAASLPSTSLSSLRIRSQSSPNILNSEDRPSTAPATKRPSSGKASKPRPSSMHRGTSFTTISELRAAGSPTSSRPQSPRSVGLSRSSTCRSPAASSSSGSSRSSSSLAGRRSLGPGFEFTPLEPRPLRLTSSSQVSSVNEFGLQTEPKPQIGYDLTYEQYLQPEGELAQQQQVYVEDGGGRAVEARSLGTFTSNLGDLSLSSRSQAMSRQSSVGESSVGGGEEGYYVPHHYRPDLSPTSTTTSSLYQPPSDPSYGYLQHSQSEPASYTTYSYLPPPEEQFYTQQQFHRQPNPLALEQQQQEQYSYQQHYPAPPPLPHHFQQQQPLSYAPLQAQPSQYETSFAPPYGSTSYGYEPAQAPPQMYHSPYQSQGGSVNPSEMHHRRVEDNGGGWMASS